MQISIRPATISDVPAMMNMVRELALYERAPEEVINDEKKMEQDGFGENPLFHSRVAANENGKIIGIAIFYIAYSTWKGKLVYLDDLIVTESFRNKGVGKMLFEELIRFCKKEKVNQFRWHVLDWNEPAIKFYKTFNAELDPTWITGKLSAEQINQFPA